MSDNVCVRGIDKAISSPKKTVQEIPLSIFKSQYKPLEALVLYLRDYNISFRDIAAQLKRGLSTISTTYYKALKKQEPIEITGTTVPFAVFQTNKVTVFEAVVHYLYYAKHYSLKEIAVLLGKSNKQLWTILHRATKKIGDKPLLVHTTTQDTQPTQQTIPLSYFKSVCSPLETVVVTCSSYGMTPAEIARLLHRKLSTITTTLHRATSKDIVFNPTSTIHLPLHIFAKHQLSILESITRYLQSSHSRKEIAVLLAKTPNQIAVMQSRIKKKLGVTS